MTVAEKAVSWAKQIALDNSHGYSQADRWGPDYDCSSFVISAFEQAGLPVRRAGAGYTGNMRSAFLACGFQDVTAQVNLVSGSGLQAGDVLLNYASHTCLYIGGGQVANARSDNGQPQSGDQSGTEIRLQGYWNYPWNCVLRYMGTETSQSGTDINVTTTSGLSKGARGEEVRTLQQLLIDAGYSVGPDGADGVYGLNTFKAVAELQRDFGLTATGEANAETMKAIDAASTFVLVRPEPEHPESETAGRTLDFPDLTSGSRGNAVLLLQAILTFRGCDCGKADAVFGAKTAAALNKFKQARGLNPDSKVDSETWNLLLTF